MKLKFPILLWIAMQSALPGQDSGDLMRKGEDALAAGLWEMAALHFNGCLSSRTLDAKVKSEVAIRLAEAWVRDGKPKEALELLEQSFVSGHPEAPFWKGQALSGLGRFADAVASLGPIIANPAAPFRIEAGFSVANLQMALGLPDEALRALSSLADIPDPHQTSKIRLHQVEILLDLERYAEARAMMPVADQVAPEDKALATFLEAHLLLGEGRAEDAASSFQTLIDQPQGQSLRRYHAAAVGLADALKQRGTPEAAVSFLIAFIQEHPDSPQLDSLFRRLLQGLPEKPAANDPVLERIGQWFAGAEIPATGPIAVSDSIAAAWPVYPRFTNLTAYSMFTTALGIHRMGTPESRARARHLLTRLRLEFPEHPLSSRAMFQIARWALDDGATERAFSILDTLRESGRPQSLQGQAAFLKARTEFSKGEKVDAAALFDEAARTLDAEDARTAHLNAAILRLDSKSTTIQATSPKDPELTADLELERALSKKTPDERRTAIEEFLTKHPQHDRVPEARIAAAECALSAAVPDLSFARAQLDTLAADSPKSELLNPARLALIRLRIQDLGKEQLEAIATARSLLETYPGDPAAAEATLILGRNLFQTNSYNDARLAFENLAASDKDADRAQAAWLLAARSAALVGTTESKLQALILFDKAIDSKGSISSIGKLEKARLLIDMNRQADAVVFLRKWFDTLEPTDPMHLPAGIMLGEAYYAQGSAQADSLANALAVYDKLIVHAEKDPAIYNHLQYQRGLTLENLPDAKDPTKKREKEAFIAYYSVLETTKPPVEWNYFELCGFRALKLLEKAERWSAAIACAKKIASFKGPQAELAATRANQLQLEHMIWED
jgi:tetratricopeptide (TPR) repeat protein